MVANGATPLLPNSHATCSETASLLPTWPNWGQATHPHTVRSGPSYTPSPLTEPDRGQAMPPSSPSMGQSWARPSPLPLYSWTGARPCSLPLHIRIRAEPCPLHQHSQKWNQDMPPTLLWAQVRAGPSHLPPCNWIRARLLPCSSACG